MKNLLFTLGIISPFTLFAQSIFIHEIDSDSPGLDSADFIELSSSTPSFNLDGYVLVLFNGGDDASYASYDLDGYTTNSNGYFVIGDTGVSGVTISLLSSGLQNGPDAVALYQANKSDFPADTPVTTTNLVDAVVYGINDADDTGLLTGLGETVQYNEDEQNDKDNHSLQRQSDGSFKAANPTPNSSNFVLSNRYSIKNPITLFPNPADNWIQLEGLNTVASVAIYAQTGQRVLTQTVDKTIDVSSLIPGIYLVEISYRDSVTLHKLIKK